MSDFKSMFPTLDDEVIEAVLRANDGAVDATIDQLLTMTIDEDMSSVKCVEGAAFKPVSYLFRVVWRFIKNTVCLFLSQMYTPSLILLLIVSCPLNNASCCPF